MSYSPIGIFNHMELEALQSLRESIVDNIVTGGGKSLMSWTSAGQTFTKQFTMPMKELLAEVNFSIGQKNGSTVKKTYARFD